MVAAFFEVTLAPLTVTLLLGTVAPLLVGLLTRLAAPSALKAVLLVTVSIVVGLVSTAIGEDGGAVISEQALTNAVIAWVAAVATHFGVWKPLNVPARLAPDFGLGKGS